MSGVGLARDNILSLDWLGYLLNLRIYIVSK